MRTDTARGQIAAPFEFERGDLVGTSRLIRPRGKGVEDGRFSLTCLGVRPHLLGGAASLAWGSQCGPTQSSCCIKLRDWEEGNYKNSDKDSNNNYRKKKK